ncbi:4-(cytidine 5'-diphospho)-2-C-methyl-D-erythritol kinase [Aeromicrobium massiliense]|uniref:4-(cytidine 5'-diphospho)-2-C-methyl-D-erythritol kinase n=1 Tax=Aeromicrobium massiliense TaxID=1464554 RepID=UPI000315A0AA|nr:4-(cytidine 5'-diphospho)-2-C-methyl-D-erythritol kinase [Aeromicrobium massiliense]
MTTTVRVPAKINVSLAVGPLGEDGFHSLATVYQAVSLYDEVTARPSDDAELHVQVHFEGLEREGSVPLDGDNLAVRAARLLREETGVDEGVVLAIRKAIPVAGGMAGGSADAAGALVACNDLWGTGLTRPELVELAAALGSDVPFSLTGGIAMGSGHGEVVSPVLASGTYHWVFAISDEGLSTPTVYAELDRLRHDDDVATPEVPSSILTALRAGDPEALGASLSNDLERAAFSLRPGLRETLRAGRSAGALGAMVSGSGPTVMFLAADEAHAADLAAFLEGSDAVTEVVQAYGPVPGARIV